MNIWRRRKVGGLKGDNAGMTLLELVIAVAIFTIAAAVLTGAFITSARMNKKADLYLEANTLAQNVMEEIKGKSFEETALAFNYPVTRSGESRFSFLEGQKDRIGRELVLKEVLPGTKGFSDARLYENTGKDASRVTASILSEDMGSTYTFLPHSSGANASKYYFVMEDVESDDQYFDVLVRFDGSSSSGYKKSTSSAQDEKNDYDMPNLSKLDTKKNGFLIMEKDWDQNAMETMIAEQNTAARDQWLTDKQKGVAVGNEPGLLDYEDVYAHTRRILQIQISENGGVVTARARYTLCAYNYVSASGNPYESMKLCPCGGKNVGKNSTDSDWIPGCFCTYTSAYTAFYSSEAGEKLSALYVFYYPNYNSISPVNPLDEIVVDNTANVDFDLYVAKQRDQSLEGNLSDYSRKEVQYRMSLTIEEAPTSNGNANWNTNVNLFRSQIRLRTNLNTNISNADSTQRASINQMKLIYQESFASGAKKTAQNAGAQNILSMNGLDVRENYDRIYEIKVGVYKQGAAKEGFPESELVSSLEGAKEK